MFAATWKQLEALEKALNDEFQNKGCPKETCPLGPRVHMIYAHYAARPDVDKVMKKWRFVTLTDYSNSSEPRYAQPAVDYLATHFLWVLTKDVKHDELPNLTAPVKPTAEDGGTLVHFKDTNFDKEQIPTKITAPGKIQDWTLVEGKDVFYASSGPGGTAATGDIEDGPGYPKKRRLCLAIPGQAGEHKDVDLAATITEKLNYHTPPQATELRTTCIQPGFKFEVKTVNLKKPTPPPKPKKGAPPPPPPPPPPPKETMTEVGKDDPWIASTRDLGASTKGVEALSLYETSSNVFVGSLVGSKWGNGVQKLASADGVTTTAALAQRYSGQLSRSRQIVFKALTKVEGACESVATYDGDKISWGINQWTYARGSETGEICQLLAYIYDFFPDAFARRFGYYGFGVWFSGRASSWNAGNTYHDPIIYRVPCCGPKIGSAIKGIHDGAKLPDEKTQRADDLPPFRAKLMAQALSFPKKQTISLAMAYVFTCAGADLEIQKAMAQWMSYRITQRSPVGKTNKEVIDSFLISLGSNIKPEVREASALAGPKAELGDKAKVEAALAEPFDDTGTAEDWMKWSVRCKNAGKTTDKSSEQTENDQARTKRPPATPPKKAPTPPAGPAGQKQGTPPAPPKTPSRK